MFSCHSRESNKTDNSIFDTSRLYSSLTMCGYSYQNTTFSSMAEDAEFVEVENVRITPAQTILKDAFEGRHYREKIVIQNCGKNTAFVRLGAPSSYAFKIKTFPHGQYLSPGLSIIRTISYTHHQKFSAPVSHIPIFINDQSLKYRITVLKSLAIIYPDPHYLDFGTVNADSTPFSKTLVLTNDGTKSSRFAVDVGSNKLQLVVKPMQGFIQPKSSISLRVEVMCHEEGKFVQELWIKCETPFRIQVSANFILPKLKVFCSNGTLDFTFFDFPRTYFGASCTRFLVIKNDSAVAKMFCIMAEIDKNVMTIKEALKKRQDFKCFHIHPIEGRLQPHEGRVIEIVFSPKLFVKTSDPNFHDDYAICYVRVIQINTIDLPGGIAFKETHEHTRIAAPFLSMDEDFDSLSISLQDGDEIYSSIKLLGDATTGDGNVDDFGRNFYRRICLHGECEKADLVIQPDSLTLSDLRINEEKRRVLALRNTSKYLKVNFRYKKCPSIEIYPNEGVINSLSTLEVSVKICPTKIGHVNTNIGFQMLYKNLPENTDVVIGQKSIPVYYSVNSVTTLPKPKFNMGITPQITNEVGILTDDIRFSTKVEKPMAAMVNTRPKRRLDDALIAFPNDRPLSLRPWTSQVPCKTIFAEIPRPKTEGGIYALNKSERETKKLLYAHYNEYIRRKRSKKVEPVPQHVDDDYDIGDGQSLLMKNTLHSCPEIKERKEKTEPFTTMTPTELYKIRIEPIVINFGKIAANSLVSKWFKIKNENDMSVRIFLECHHNSVTFTNGRRLVVSSQSEVQIQIQYKASENGRFIIPIRVIFNECHFSQVILVLEAVEKYVEINVMEVHFYSNDLDPKHIDIRNPLNAPVKFRWEIPKSCFVITPLQGTIEPKMTYPCLVTFRPDPKYDTRIDVILILENNANITVPIWVEMVQPDVVLERNAFMISGIALNQPVRRKFVLKNNSFEPISFAVLNPRPVLGISLFPSECVLHGKSELIITVELKIEAYVSFNCDVQLELQKSFILNILISGDVEFPYISIEPKELLFNKLSVGATQCLPFRITNHSKSLLDVKFDLESFPDFSISEKHLSHPVAKSKKIALESKITKELCLYFTPNDVTYYNFLLPFIINDLLGPPILDDSDSLWPDKYYEEIEKLYLEHNINPDMKTAEPLDAIRINARANANVLNFSSLELNFCYFPNTDYDSVTENFLEITNISDNDVKFSLRTDDFETNYSLSVFSEKRDITFYENACVCCLETKASVIYKISFHPMVQGTYNITIPVYVRDVSEDLFNYINLNGIYPVPSIQTPKSVIYLKPVPLGCTSKKTISLKTSYHMHDCSIKTDVSSCSLLLDFENGNEINFKNIHSELQVTISFKSMISVNKRENVRFFCACPAECTIVVITCSENSIVTNHAFLENCSFKKIDSVFRPFLLKTDPKEADECTRSFSSESSSFENILKIPESMHVFENAVYNNDDSYPFFPTKSDESENAQYMRKSLSALENWVYEQCFYSMSYYSIPRGIATNPVTFEMNQEAGVPIARNEEESGSDKLLPFLQLLKNLGGNSVNELIPIKPLPEDHFERIVYLYTIYDKILNFLVNEKASLLHVQAEYLFEYENYVDYKKYLENPKAECDVMKESILDEYSFHWLRKQYWMDIILQTFKIFVLSRIQLSLRERKVKHYDQKSLVSFKTQSSSIASACNFSFINLFKEAQLPTLDVYSTAELMLLSWLEYNFEKQRKTLWPNCVLEPRHVQHFDFDLQDGIILACITAQHCTYLADCFQEFFLEPKTYEEYIFNAIKLTDAWRSIHISFHILPEEIAKPNRIQMLLLVTYLYDFLPGFIAKESLTLIAKHTLSIQETIEIKNKNDAVISYRIKLFSNYPQFFNISKTTLVIGPRKSCSFTITFHARKLIKVSGTLVFCGDTPGYKYAKSIAIKVEGVPDVSFVNGELAFQGNLYEIFEKHFSVISPYKEKATYDLYYFPGIPDHIDELKSNLITYKSVKDLKLPRRFYNKANQVKCDSNGIANTFAIYCGLHPRNIQWVTYYCNNEVGDFSTKTSVFVNTSRTVYETIYVRLPRGLSTLVCQCKKTVSKFGKCPRELIIEMPQKNNLMWACIQRMFFEVLSEEDIPFWTKHLYTSAGNHIMKYMFYEERDLPPIDIKHIFNKTVTYKVVFDKKNPPAAELPKEITIDDVLTDGVFNVSIHLNTDKPKSFYFDMISADQAEIRYYKVEFLPEL